ncbi:MAG: hypothetical protein RJA44_2253 [Pseudomonadota bacterium]
MSSPQGITEADIARYLASTPGFFERHADLLASVQLASPHSHRTISLQQRQMEMLRDRIKGLERRIMDMIRHGQENASIADRLHAWIRTVMLVQDPLDLPTVLVDDLMQQFLIPQAALRLWHVAPAYARCEFALGADEEVQHLASSLSTPYCGPNTGFELLEWLDEPEQVASLALIPLRRDAETPAFGLLVLASPDPTRYGAEMATDFLVRVGELASAAVTRLLPA